VLTVVGNPRDDGTGNGNGNDNGNPPHRATGICIGTGIPWHQVFVYRRREDRSSPTT
jgi:hypothetical protein